LAITRSNGDRTSQVEALTQIGGRRRCIADETPVMGTVREAVPAEAAAVEAVWAAVAAEGEWIGMELPFDRGWRDRFLAALAAQDSAWFVADVGGHVVGGVFVQAVRGVAHFGMAIVEAHRGIGLGRALLNAAVGWARDRGCHKVTLEVWPHNTRARQLYRSAGFADEGYLRCHYRRKSGALWDAVIMAVILDKDSPGRP
jgi:ribosomal protein S18 acetylase RimI-like enzyme